MMAAFYIFLFCLVPFTVQNEQEATGSVGQHRRLQCNIPPEETINRLMHDKGV